MDYEYERAGTASIFMFTEPLAGKRGVTVRERRTKIDWAFEMEQLLSTHYAHVEKVILVCDNLNTHTRGAFYEAFPAEKAREIVKKIEFHYTPPHASWLNVAEIEIGIMDRECTSRRIKSEEMLVREVKAWEKRRNRQRKKIVWTFTKQKADRKLGKYYTE